MSTEKIVVIVVSAILALAWIPVGIHFWRSWRRRGSPLSLAICGLIGFPVFTNSSTYIFLTGNKLANTHVMVGANLLLWINFLVCFRWQKKSFPEARNRPPRTSEPPDFWKMSPSQADIDEDAVTPPR